MKLTTKGRYAARAMLELALNHGNGPLQLREIAQKQEISERYLERMMRALVTAGLVRSTRGKHGGFSLAKNPDEILLSLIAEHALADRSACEAISFLNCQVFLPSDAA